MITLKSTLSAAAAAAVLAVATLTPALAENAVVAKINGHSITELDMKLAESEIGSDLGNLPTETRRRVLVEFLIENHLFADAALSEKLNTGKAFDERMQYMRRRALRETYFEEKIRKSVSEAAAKTFYTDRVKGMKPKEEIKARHILVKSEETADDLKEQIARGADFAELAKQHSTDPGSKVNGGMLGFFSRGQMVPAFEQAAFELKKGEVSDPVQSRFGFHLIKLEDRRQKPVPTFDDVKEQILNSLIHQQTQAKAATLRERASIEYIDAGIKAEVEAQKKKASTQQRSFEQQVEQMHKKPDQSGADTGKKKEATPTPAP